MKKFSVLMFLPALLLALETVNLLKDASFEKDSEVWTAVAGSKWASEGKDSAQANRHDPANATDGSFSASGDTRIAPAWFVDHSFDSALVIYGEFNNKKISDLDSLIWDQKVIPRQGSNPEVSTFCFVVGFFLDAYAAYWFEFGYFYQNPFFPDISWPRWHVMRLELPEDTLWWDYARDLKLDMLEVWNLSPGTTVDSFLLISWGHWYGPNSWFGQKIYWDDIRLMGYADYDVGVKEILSGDSLREGHPYTPEARIKNFGREPADTFLVIAEIAEESGLDSALVLYADTLPHSLPPDTEDIVSFTEFAPDHPGPYTLRIRTVMEPDESDADDELSKPLIYEAITEAPHPDAITLEVRSIAHPLCVAYSLPYGESGTLTLYDATGRWVEQMSVKGSGEVLFSSSLPSGVYLVRLQTKQTAVTRKAVVLR